MEQPHIADIENITKRRIVIICIFIPCAIVGGLNKGYHEMKDYVQDLFEEARSIWDDKP